MKQESKNPVPSSDKLERNDLENNDVQKKFTDDSRLNDKQSEAKNIDLDRKKISGDESQKNVED